jgi:hypothetical protein
MLKTILMLLLFTYSTALFASEPCLERTQEMSKQEEIDLIDEQIKVLEDRKNRYKASARRHQDQVDRWQFDSSRIDEMRKERENVEIDETLMRDIQIKIDELKQQKEEILNAG